jgi:hypothetical protein
MTTKNKMLTVIIITVTLFNAIEANAGIYIPTCYSGNCSDPSGDTVHSSLQVSKQKERFEY